MPRNACVIQITPVRLTRTSANDASVVRKIYLSIDPIVTARSHRAAGRTATNPLRTEVPSAAPPPYPTAIVSPPSLCSVNKMAAPWHGPSMVNNSFDVAERQLAHDPEKCEAILRKDHGQAQSAWQSGASRAIVTDQAFRWRPAAAKKALPSSILR